MKTRTWRLLICLLVTSGLASVLQAQEAHPLAGNWIGYWGPSPDHQNRVLVAIDWDGTQITGIVNPGAGDMTLNSAALDPSDWSVRFEFDADLAGTTVTYVVEGVIENLGSPHRSIVGTWRHGTASGDFRITLQ